MTKFRAIFKRELKVYFTSPIAYAVIFIFTAVSGYFFYSTLSYYALLSYQAARSPFAQGLNPLDLVYAPLFGNLSVTLLLMLPILTMRLLAEEKKSGTFELLFSYPVRDIDVLLGKYLAALVVFLVMTALTGFYQLILYSLDVYEAGVALSGYLGLVLAGAAFISLGLFISSLTENQIVAAVITFGVLILFWIVGWSAPMAEPPYDAVLSYISLLDHLINFSRGIIDTADIIYYLCFIVFFLFLTLRGLESKRWKG
jgi:ABC-2 type transport system permease protein